MMRLQVDHYAARIRAGAPFRFGPSPGFDDLRWIRPVYAGDRITFAGQVTHKRRSRSRPGMAIITTAFTGTNQDDKPVLSMTAQVFVWVGVGS